MKNFKIEKISEATLAAATQIWNSVVKRGDAFPQEEPLTEQNAKEFFDSQTFTAVALSENDVVGLYILHPNNVGRCSHIANASFAVKEGLRGEGIGRKLVCDCLLRAKQNGFKIMQFNAVVENNYGAIKLYESLGFTLLGTIPDGFKNYDGKYLNIRSYFKVL